MEAWLADPQLLEADKGAKYSAEIHINMDDIKVMGRFAVADLRLVVSVLMWLLVRICGVQVSSTVSLKRLVNENYVCGAEVFEHCSWICPVQRD
jgi:hypothetical protein